MDEKSKQLGIPFGTATNRLRKLVLFGLLKKYKENYCYRCGGEIVSSDELSMEHKKAWLHIDSKLFWDLDNIAFSHLNCNTSEHRTRDRNFVHGTVTAYRYGCRCDECVEVTNKDTRERVRKGRLLDKNYGR